MQNDNAKRHITQIRLENFQCYEDTTISLSSGINLITGSSDHGKTAFVRAMKFVMHNVWSPVFMRMGADECRVTVWFSDGTVVQRIKGDRRNAVLVRYANGKAQAFDKIGNTLPAAVIKALGNPPIDDSHGALAFAEQLEPMFMVMLGSSELPRNISQLTDIDDLDEAATLLSRRSKQADKQAKELLKRINRYEAELTEYEDLDDKLEKLQTLEEQEEHIDGLLQEITDGNDIIRRYADVMQEGALNSKALKRANNVLTFSDSFYALREKADILEDMQNTEEDYNDVCDDILESQTAMIRAKKITESGFQEKLDHIRSLLTIIDDAKETLENAEEIETEISDIQEEITTFNKNKTKLENLAEKIRNELKDKGLWCPACNRPLVEDACQK